MAKTNKDKQCYTKHIEERQTIPWLYNIVCPCWFWPWYCLTFFDVFYITLFILVDFGHGIVLRSLMCFVLHVRQYHSQNQPGQKMLYKTHQRTSDNTMAKTNKDKQCYTKQIEERQTSLLVLAMVLYDLVRCALYNIVFPCWFWPWYCLTFFDVFCITLFVLVGFAHVIQNTSKNVRQYHGQNHQGKTMLYKAHRTR
jgi:hypothetical protein